MQNAEKYCKIIKILKIPKNESIKHLIIGNTELDQADYIIEHYNMPKICPRHAQDMPQICPRYAQEVPEICPR